MKKLVAIILILSFLALNVTAEGSLTITKINDLYYSIIQNDKFSLPTKITAFMSDSSKQEVAITWDKKLATTSKTGLFTFKGTVKGYNKKVSLTLDIKKDNITETSSIKGDQKKIIEGIVIPTVGEPVLIEGATERQKQIYNKAKEIIKKVIKPHMTEYEKELAIHDYIVLNTAYDYENYINNTIPADSYEVYGVLIKGSGVCSGYARTMCLLLNMVGIETQVVSGSANARKGWEGHAWNIVKLGGEFYHLDATWNDSVPDKKGYAGREYFNAVDDKMVFDHRWESSSHPKCEGIRYYYDYYKYCADNGISIKSEPGEISGTLSLPPGVKAPKGGIEAAIRIWTNNETPDTSKDDYYYSAMTMIPEGNNSAAFTIKVPPIAAGYSVSYILSRNLNGYLTYGYYNIEGTKAYRYQENYIYI